jgi:hypothetical protein
MRARRPITSKISDSIPSLPDAAKATDARRARIAEAAYLLAQTRNFAPGQEDQDWLAAEAAIDGDSTNGTASPGKTAPKVKSTKPQRRKRQAPEA